MAISADGISWFLINASPDLRAQVESFPALQPRGASARNTPIRDVLLTNADLDHVLGLFLLREQRQKVRIHSTAAVRDTLCRGLRIDALLASFCGVEWHELQQTGVPFGGAGEGSGFTCRAIPLPGDAPRYALDAPGSGGQSVALEIVDQRSGSRLVVAPDVAAITSELQAALEKADAVFFDGTFWAENELRAIDPAARTASQMGHLPISGGSLDILRALPARRRIYLHINNTNPILMPGSPERAEVENAGIDIGEDGMEFEL